MKPITSIILFFVVLQVGCDTKENNAAKTFNENAGKQIPMEIAQRWIENKRNYSGARIQEQTYSINASMLQAALQGSDNIGISFHHATDAGGTEHVLAVTVTENSSVENPLANAPFIIDTNASVSLDNNTAQAWVTNYESTHSGQVQYYFFGLHVFNEILSNASFNYLEVVAALDEQNEPQQLLFVWNGSETSGGRTQILPVVYDFSSKCPPCDN